MSLGSDVFWNSEFKFWKVNSVYTLEILRDAHSRSYWEALGVPVLLFPQEEILIITTWDKDCQYRLGFAAKFLKKASKFQGILHFRIPEKRL